MEQNNCNHFSKRGLFGWFITHLNECDGANGSDSCLYEDRQHLCPNYQPKEKKQPLNKKNMNTKEEVSAVKALRRDLDGQLQKIKSLTPSRETSLAITKMQECIMWLGMRLKAIGEADPYPESRNPESQTIHPTADGLKL